MDEPLGTRSVNRNNEESSTDLVELGNLHSPGEDLQEQAMQGEKSGEGNEDGKDHITLLPFEVMSKAFAQLSREERLTTTSLVCKKFMDVNRSYIYKFIHINLGNQREGGEDNPGLEEFGAWFATLLKHDQLRGRIVSLAFKVHHHDLYLQVQGHLENLVKHLKSLRELSLNPPPSRYDFPTNPMTTFLRLDFHYDRTTFWQGFPSLPPLELTQFFYIDHIRKLQIEHISLAPELHRGPFSIRRDKTSLIDDLRFIDCSPQTVGKLPDLLLLPQSLKCFVLETKCPWSVAQTPRARPHTMDAQQLHQALEPHYRTLETLVIAFSDGAGFLGKPTLSLAGWSSLTTLALPEAFLVCGRAKRPLHAVLPSRLVELQIQFPQLKPSMILRLEQLAGNKKDCMPELNRVVVWHQGRDQENAAEGGDLGDLEMLQGLFGSVGTKFEWCFESTFAGTPLGKVLGVESTGGRGQNVHAHVLDAGGASGVGLYYDEDTHSVF